ncbi:TPA: HNH endonuclease [Candidatus Avigastranaerophilus faecigallinarum]|nr:HNH endonuclease [Candidatus Avigastranaerophilus faecigallinarum]
MISGFIKRYNHYWKVSKAQSNTLYIADPGSVEDWYILVQSPSNTTIFLGYHNSKNRKKSISTHIKTTPKPKTRAHIIYENTSEISKYIVINRKYDDYQYFFNGCNFYAVPIYKKEIILDIDVAMSKYIEITDINFESVFPDELSSEKNNYKEGAIKTITVNAYERNTKAKMSCLEYYGTKCKICGFEFSKKYGEQFKNKIHVHHVKPLSTIKSEYKLNPITDLIPVCPNCHMILHSKGKNEAYTIDEVRKFIKDNSF